eukprot:scaffold66165_cov57-Phaeocystis_antarctica.AAC.1
MSARWEETPLTLPRLVGCEQLDPRAPPPAPTPTPTPDAASLPASSQQGACGAAGSQAGSGGAAPARAANGGGGGGGGGSSVWDAEEEEEEAEDEEAAPERGGDEYTFGRTGAPPVEGTVSGDVSALGGLMGSYAKKRVRWADEEQAKDDDFNRTKAGFTLQVGPRRSSANAFARRLRRTEKRPATTELLLPLSCCFPLATHRVRRRHGTERLHPSHAPVSYGFRSHPSAARRLRQCQ